jgi:uncharacterized protein (DUF1778 family)
METKTVNLRNMPDELVTRAKLYATLRGLTLKDFIIEAIRKALEQAGAELASVTMFVTTGNRQQEKGFTKKSASRKRRHIKEAASE